MLNILSILPLHVPKFLTTSSFNFPEKSKMESIHIAFIFWKYPSGCISHRVIDDLSLLLCHILSAEAEPPGSSNGDNESECLRSEGQKRKRIKFHVYRCDGKKTWKNSKKTIPIQMNSKSIENREDHNTFVAKLEHLGFMGWLRSFCKWEHRT